MIKKFFLIIKHSVRLFVFKFGKPQSSKDAITWGYLADFEKDGNNAFLWNTYQAYVAKILSSPVDFGKQLTGQSGQVIIVGR